MLRNLSAPTTPGCALGVLKDGKMLYSHGYGLADVEHSIPITPTTVFHIASVSKQFTAFAIYILASEGKLSVDDDVRKYLPELHDFHTTITIRNLLNHTSGIRDQWNLLTGQQKAPIFPSSNTSFSLETAGAQLTFDRPTHGGQSPGLTLHQGGHDHYAKRVESAHLTPEKILAYTGTFYSDALDTLYTLSSRDGRLFVRYPRGESELKPTITNMFEAELPFGTVNYRCSANNHCDTFTVTNGRVRRLRFDRVDLTPITHLR